MSVKSKHSSTKKEKSVKKEKKKKDDSDEDIESSEEELDLTKECHPIGYYMNDRPEMINQMFFVIKGNKLKAMLPPVLKDYDVEQLKVQCLDQLLGMSEKRITCILEGETLETSSESEVAESDECDSEEKNGTSSGSSSDKSDDSQDDRYTKSTSVKHHKRKSDAASEGKSGKLPKTESEPPEQGKTLLEILELEMRARAIRALLKQSVNEKANDQTTDSVKENMGEVVDLTECEDEGILSVKKEASKEEIDKKVSEFEEKIEKSKPEKSKEDEKSKKLQAELELRNKLFRKKIYRTRQQRMENEEEEKPVESECEPVEVVIKQEPIEQEEIVVEDPEEGEISTSEDEYPVEIKQEIVEAEVPQKSPEVAVEPVEFETKIYEDGERITAIDNGMFETESNMSKTGEMEQEATVLSEAVSTEEGSRPPAVETTNDETQPGESNVNLEETSWRDRWLRKDDMQKLVKSSKIYAKVKKRIAEKTHKAKEEVPSPNEAISDTNSNSKLEVIEGSIEEYERLLKNSQGHNEVGINGKAHQSTIISDESKTETGENVTQDAGT